MRALGKGLRIRRGRPYVGKGLRDEVGFVMKKGDALPIELAWGRERACFS